MYAAHKKAAKATLLLKCIAVILPACLILLYVHWPASSTASGKQTQPPADPRTRSAPAASTITVVSFNIRYGSGNTGQHRWDNRVDEIVEFLRELSPDIAGLQEAEAFQCRELLEKLSDYAMTGVGRDDGKIAGEFSPIFYNRTKYTLDEAGTFWLSETPDKPGSRDWRTACTRICSWARFIDIRTSRGFYLYNTHLDHIAQSARLNGTRLICRNINQRKHPDPVIFCGDFNAAPDNPLIKQIQGLSSPESESWLNEPLLDAIKTAYGENSIPGTFNGFGRHFGTDRIDYIFCSPDFQVTAGAVDTRHTAHGFLSDHYPVWTTLAFE